MYHFYQLYPICSQKEVSWELFMLWWRLSKNSFTALFLPTSGLFGEQQFKGLVEEKKPCANQWAKIVHKRILHWFFDRNVLNSMSEWYFLLYIYTDTNTYINMCLHLPLFFFFSFVSSTTLINLTSYSSKNCYKETQPIFISPAKLLTNMYWEFITLLKVWMHSNLCSNLALPLS